jgi:hypothetical protein
VQNLRGGDPSDVGAWVAAENQEAGRRGNASIPPTSDPGRRQRTRRPGGGETRPSRRHGTPGGCGEPGGRQRRNASIPATKGLVDDGGDQVDIHRRRLTRTARRPGHGVEATWRWATAGPNTEHRGRPGAVGGGLEVGDGRRRGSALEVVSGRAGTRIGDGLGTPRRSRTHGR